MSASRWYMINAIGMATHCVDKADAEQEARDADASWPHLGPHRAVQLVELSTVEELRDAARAVVDRWGTPHWKLVTYTDAFIARLRRALE